MKILSVVALSLSIVVGPAVGEKIGDLPDLNQPASIKLAGDTVYISDRDRVHIIKLEPFGPVRSFGKAGEGPGEFNSVPHLSVGSEDLFINCMGKTMVFSRKGDFISQTKLPFRLWYFYYPLMRVKSHYVGFPVIRSQEEDAFLFFGKIYDSGLKEVAEFYKGNSPRLLPPPRPGTPVRKQPFEVIPDCLAVATDGQRIFVADTRKGFHIGVYDENGRAVHEIHKNEPPLPVPGSYRSRYMQELRESDDWESLKNRFDYRFKSHYPAFFSFKLKEDRLLVTTYFRKDTGYELIEMDLQGRILRRSFSFPMGPEEGTLSGLEGFANQYDVQGDSLYHLKYNDEIAGWELHRTVITPTEGK